MPYSRLFMMIAVFALTAACGSHSSTSFGVLKKSESFIGSRDKLVTAINEGDYATLEAMIAKGLDPNTKLENGRTLLIQATIQNQIRVTSLLIKKGANPALTDLTNKTALDYAKDSGNLRAWILLDADKQNSERAILIDAVRKKRLLKVGTQLENGTDPNFVDLLNQGETPLTLALEIKASLVAEKIAAWKDPFEITNTDVNLANQSGVRPLTKAKSQGLSDLIPLLESLGAKE